MTLFDAIDAYRLRHTRGTCPMCGRQGTQTVEFGHPYQGGEQGFQCDVVRTCGKCKHVTRSCVEGTA